MPKDVELEEFSHGGGSGSSSPSKRPAILTNPFLYISILLLVATIALGVLYAHEKGKSKDDNKMAGLTATPPLPTISLGPQAAFKFNNCPAVCSTKNVNYPNACSLPITGVTNETIAQTKIVGTVMYPGTCGCPNFCFSEFNKGTCDNGRCVCKDGWSGADCSLPSCSGEAGKCSGHGTCMKQAGEADSCKCDAGWTLMDCSAMVPPAEDLTFPIVVQTPYWRAGGDKYGGDNSILYDHNSIAEWHITMAPQDVANMLESPFNLTDAAAGQTTKREWFPATVARFRNGKVQKSLGKGKMKIRGNTTPFLVSKPLSFKLEDAFENQKQVNFLPEARDATFLHNYRATETFRAMGVTSSRHAYCVVYINQVFYGVYWMYEALDKPFFDARFGTHSHKNGSSLYKCPRKTNAPPDCVAQYPGANCGIEFGEGQPMCNLFDSVTNSPATLGSQLDIDAYLRTVAAEAFLGNWDGSVGGGGFQEAGSNNYFWYYGPPQGHDHGPVSDSERAFQLILHDYEFSQGAVINLWSEDGRDCWNTTMTLPPNPPLPSGFKSQYPNATSEQVKLGVLKQSPYFAKLLDGAGCATSSLYTTDKSEFTNATFTPYPAREVTPINRAYHQTFLNWMGTIAGSLYWNEQNTAMAPGSRMAISLHRLLSPVMAMNYWHMNNKVWQQSLLGYVSLVNGGNMFCYAPPAAWGVARAQAVIEQIKSDWFV